MHAGKEIDGLACPVMWWIILWHRLIVCINRQVSYTNVWLKHYRRQNVQAHIRTKWSVGRWLVKTHSLFVLGEAVNQSSWLNMEILH